MVYKHAVKAFGRVYPAGEDVPEVQEVKEKIPDASETEKVPKRTHKSAQEKQE